MIARWLLCLSGQQTGLEKVTVHEEKLLEVQSDPVRSYLLEHIMPTLSQGLAQCCREQPQDPLDFLVLELCLLLTVFPPFSHSNLLLLSFRLSTC